MTAEPITIYRAVVRPIGVNKTPAFTAPYRVDRSKAEVDKISFIADRKKMVTAPELYEVQVIPAFRLEDGRVAIVVQV